MFPAAPAASNQPPSATVHSMDYRNLQAWVLRAVAIVELFAFGAVVMPLEWMIQGHRWLGLGDLSQAPAVEAVMRQVSFSYGLHGIALLVIASDVGRYRPLVILSALGYLVYGAVFLLTDIGLGMPRLWVVGNGGSCLLVGTILLGLLWAEARESARF